MQKITTNYHTHHRLCHHAKGEAADYVKQAILEGFTEIGISDHAPSRLLEGDRTRMKESEVPIYLRDIAQAREQYGDKITILTGFETEYLDKDPTYYEELLRKADYLLLGQHYIRDRHSKNGRRSTFKLKTPEHLVTYAKSVAEAMSTGYFAFVAHPDIYMTGYPVFDETARKAAHIITDAALKYDIPLEINAQGIRRGHIESEDGQHYRYPRKPFFKIAKEKGCRIIVGADAHNPRHLNDQARQTAIAFAEHLDIILDEQLDIKR